jgi:hypothetical protein
VADSYIIIDEPAVTDKKLDTEQITVGANTVERERFIIAGVGATDLIKPVAHDAVSAGSPMPIGGYAKAAAPTDVSADGDRVNAWFDLGGRLQVGDGGLTLSVDDGAGNLSIDDGGNSITVDGSVTVTQGTGTNLHTVIDSGTVSTITNVVHVDDNGGSLTVDGTVTATIAAGATTIAKAEDVASADADVGVPALAVRKATPANTSGTDGDYEFLQMSAGRLWTSATIDAALPAGANAIGKLATNGGVTIGDVNVISEIPGTGATNLGKAEDAAHSSGDTGVMVLAVRNDTPSTALSGTNGDYTPIATDSAGRVYVEQKSTTATLSNVASSASSVTVLASNTARIAAQVYNDSTQILYLHWNH